MSVWYRRKRFRRWDFYSGLREIIRLEREPNNPLPISKRLKSLISGFSSTSWLLYGFEQTSDPDYFPDAPHLLYMRRLNKDEAVFDNKLLFRAIYGAILDIPANLCLINRGQVIPLPSSGLTDTIESVLNWSRLHGPIIWKPTNGRGGGGVYRIRCISDVEFEINGKAATADEVHRLARTRDDFLVCPSVLQGKYSQTIFPDAVNTVRIWTMRDPETGKAFLATAAHRFGTAKSRPVDNWAAGGLVAPIALESGTLESAAAKPVAGHVRWFDHHPDSGSPIAGVAVPNWEHVVKELLRATEVYPNICHCAWDVVVREDGCCVLEGNNFPTLTMLQLRGGILKNSRVRHFFKHHGLID